MPNRSPELLHKRSCFIASEQGDRAQNLRVADETWGRNQDLDRPRFTACLLALVLNGRGRLQTDGMAGSLLPGRVFALEPERHHHLQVERDLHLRLVVSQDPTVAADLATIAPGTPAIWEPPRPACIDAVLEELLVAAEEGGPGIAALGHQSLRLLLALLRHAPRRAVAGGAAATFTACREAIARAALRLSGVDDAAALCGLDRAYLARLFKRHGGESPSDFLLRHKMRHAADQLAAGTSVADCAAACGYHNSDVFSRAFRRHFGQNPSRWRRQIV